MLKIHCSAFLVLVALFAFAQEKKRDLPNIVFIISDQHKKDQTGAYGSKTSITPNIDQLAKTGVTFQNCYTPAPVCAPARAALITGMYPYANEAIYHKAPVKMPNGKIKNVGSGYLRETGYAEGIVTMAESLKTVGYRTAAPGKMHVHGELQKNVDEDHRQGNYMGFDEISARYYTYFPGGHYEDLVGTDAYQRYRQFEKYRDVYPKGPMHLNQEYVPTLVENEEDIFDMVVARGAVDFIKRSSNKESPFFIHVGFEKPHAPFTTTQKYLDLHDPDSYELPETFDDWYSKGKYPWVPNWIHSGIPKNLDEAQNVMAAYNACITEMDDMVGRVVQALKDNGEYENTIIIYTTDHGEHLFEHGLRGKHCMYEEAVNIPFIVSFPKLFKQGVMVNSLVSLIDVYPTLCELAGAEIPETVQGKSLIPILTKAQEFEDRVVFSEFRGADYELIPKVRNVPSRMLRTGDFKFIYTHGIVHQLYNLNDDPNELVNLAMNPANADMVRDFYFQTMAEWRFQKYFPIKASAKDGMLRWPENENMASFSIYYSDSADPQTATVIESGLSATEYQMKKSGCYWILADPLFSKTSTRFGDTPVAVENYDFKLPISDPIEF
ncbi:sulfatase [Marinoscillum sp. MHG1-6]|uniref:sulfatase family protein n=1 Tax=Marinoscillum sp. MHG1-6 TaxID=2959627 RepID=UPI002156F852|nr:sulfatase-like hydrolase/transferase [Marinoscillum sp. MHG1-6]